MIVVVWRGVVLVERADAIEFLQAEERNAHLAEELQEPREAV